MNNTVARTPSTCRFCGAEIPPGARHCPRCDGMVGLPDPAAESPFNLGLTLLAVRCFLGAGMDALLICSLGPAATVPLGGSLALPICGPLALAQAALMLRAGLVLWNANTRAYGWVAAALVVDLLFSCFALFSYSSGGPVLGLTGVLLDGAGLVYLAWQTPPGDVAQAGPRH